MGSSYDDWTVHQLKWTLKERGLPVSGNKRVLIERLESSEGLEGSDLVYICQVCGEKFKSRNKLSDHLKHFPDHTLESSMAASKPTSEEKNYLAEWALDAEDAGLVEQIREKYRAPSYKSRSKRKKQPYPLKLSIAIIVLCFVGICGAYLFEMGPEIERQGGDSNETYSACCTSFLLFAILGAYIHGKNKEMDLTSNDSPPVVNFLVSLGGLGFLLAIYLNFLDGNGASVMDAVTCLSSLVLILIPMSLFAIEENPGEKSQDEEYRWSNACKLEEEGWFDTATRIWSELGEDGEVERVAELKVEYMCVILKRKIKALTEQGADCTQLEEQWATIETALEGSTTSLSSVGMQGEEVALTVEDSTITPSPDIDLEEHTGESLKEIEEDEEEEHTLVKDSVVSQINAGAGEDDKLDKLKELIEMKEKGLIDDDEFKQMMMESMGTESKE